MTQEQSDSKRGLLVTFEGGDGAGKSTQIRFLARFLEERGYEVLRLREPGGTAVGEALRRVVLDPAHGAMSDRAELLIYEAARAQIVDEVIAPALARGAVVLCDRFYDSTVAYQGAGRGLDGFFIETANRFACDGLVPDLTILLVAPEKVVRSRMGRRGGADRLERAGDEFHRRVAAGFDELAAADPARVRRVCSQQQRPDTFRAVLAELAPLLPGVADALAADDGALDALVSQVMAEKRRERERERKRDQTRKRRPCGSKGDAKRAVSGKGDASGRRSGADAEAKNAESAKGAKSGKGRKKGDTRKGGGRKGRRDEKVPKGERRG